jgi:hypothetical protein
MRNNAFTQLLVGVTALSILATAGLAFYYVQTVRKLNYLQSQAAIINRNRTLVNALVMETVEYSKRNPAIDPILQSVNIKARPGAPSSPKPAKP